MTENSGCTQLRDMINEQRNMNKDQVDYRFECYRSNHCEIVLTDYEKDLKVEELRLATIGAKLNKLSGELTLSVAATGESVEYINTLHEGMLYNIKYTLYSPDGNHNIVILNRLMKLMDISFESYTDPSDVSVVKLYFFYA